MNKNFAGQTFNNRSFRKEHLTGADFSGCTLNSCDFRDADLTDVTFNHAMFGVSLKWRLIKTILSLLIGVLSGLLAVGSGFFFLDISQEIGQAMDTTPENSFYVTFTSVIAFIGFIASVLLSLRQKQWHFIIGYWIVFIIVLVGAGAEALTGTIAVALAGTAAGAGTLALVLAGTVAGTVAGTLALVLAGTVAAAGAGATAAAGAAAAAIGSIAILTILFCWYLNRRAVKTEEAMLLPLRRTALAWQSWHGTQFSGARLCNTDFSEADLRYTRLTGAQFKHPVLTGAKNLHLARTVNTPLQSPIIRKLLTSRTVDTRDFSFQHVRGLSFKGIDLSECNFYHADLSEADFSDCNLTDANLSEAMVFGTLFDRAQLTGAIIDNWGMDKHTRFNDAVCAFVYTQRDQSERNPPNGEFKPGEFSKLYQEIANTVDFIVHSSDELEALLRAIESIKQQGGDIVIQSLERKNESVVIRTQSDAAIDKAAIYAEVKAQAAVEMNRLEQRNKMLELELKHTKESHQRESELQARHNDTLAQFVTQAIEHNKVEIMHDNSRNITNSTVSHSALNQGDASTVSNHIEQVADPELKADLRALQNLIQQSSLSANDKKTAQESIDELATVSHQPEAERKSLARRSLAFLKDLHTDLSDAIEVGKQYGALIARIIAWF